MATIRTRRWRSADGTVKTAVVVDYADQAGVRRLKTFNGDEAKAKKAAAAWLARAKVQIDDGLHQPESTTTTLGKALDLWVQRAEAEGLERGTVQMYGQHRARLLELLPARLKLAKLTRARCEQLRDDLLKHHTRATARKLLVSFKSALREARRRGLMVADPAAETSIGSGGRHKRKLKVGVDLPTVDEFKAMLAAAAGPKERALLRLAGIAALRASEFRGLPWADVDLGAEPSVTITQRADKWGTIGSPKSEAAMRKIELGRDSAQQLKEWRLAQPGGRTLVFGTAADKPDLLGNLQERILDKIQQRAGVLVDGKPKYSWHGLRHFGITQWIVGGRHDLKTVQYLSGHATLALTLDRYGHFVPSKDAHARASEHEAAMLG